MKILTPDEYYQSYAFFTTAKKLQGEARIFEKLFVDIIGETVLTDLIYDPDKQMSKDEFTRLLSENGFDIEWKPKSKVVAGG